MQLVDPEDIPAMDRLTQEVLLLREKVALVESQGQEASGTRRQQVSYWNTICILTMKQTVEMLSVLVMKGSIDGISWKICALKFPALVKGRHSSSFLTVVILKGEAVTRCQLSLIHKAPLSAEAFSSSCI